MPTRCAAPQRPRRRPRPNRAPLRRPARAPLPRGKGRRTKRRAPSRTCWHNSCSTTCSSAMATILVHIALLAYAAGAAAFLTWLVRPDGRLARAGRLLLLAGVVVHFAAFGASLGIAGAGLGLSAWKGGQLFSLLAAVTVAGYLVLDFRYELPGAGAPGHVQRARHRAPGLPQPPALRARGRGGAGNGGARARLRARHSLPGKRKPDEEQAAREAVRAPALARADRSCRVPVGGVGIRFPLAGDRHRFAGVARGDRRDVPVRAQAGVRRPRLGAVRRPHPGAARRGLARAEGCVPGGRGIRAADRDVRWPALGGARAAGDGRMMLICVGLSHRQAPIAVRERVAVAPEQIEARLRQLKALPGVREALLLSTCNRVEIFAVAESRGAGEDLLQGLGPVA